MTPGSEAASARPPTVVYLFSGHRGLGAALRHNAPDSGLFGQNYLHEFGIEATIHAPQRRRRSRTASQLAMLAAPWSVRADVLFATGGLLIPLSGRGARAARGRPRVVLFNYNLSARCTAASRAERRGLQVLLRAARAIVCPSEAQREFLISEMDLPAERVHTVHVGVDTEFFRPQPPCPDGYVLAVGRDLGRDYATLFRAVAGLGRRCVVVTSARNVAGLDVPPEVDVQLDVSPRRLGELYGGASCVVVPTKADGDGAGCDCSGQTVLLEAMASSRPVVATQRSSLRGYVEDGFNAVVVPAADAAALGGAIRRVLEDDRLAQRLGMAAEQTVHGRHSSRHFAQRLAPVLLGAAR